MSNSALDLAVCINSVGRQFPGENGLNTVLNDVNLQVRHGEIISIIGASGSGKSTLLRCIAGLDVNNTGEVSIGGNTVKAYDSRTAVGFQEPRLLPWRTIADNVKLGLPSVVGKKAARTKVAELLELVELSHAAHLRPKEVSGGMAQRASLARALAREPKVLLLDEPFGALDALTRIKMQDLLLDVHATIDTTILLVTHDVDEALRLSDRILLLGTNGNGVGATVQDLCEVPGARPRDLAQPELLELSARLYAGLGVHAGRSVVEEDLVSA